MIIRGDVTSLDELAHVGVLGMKWGHHKAPEPTNAAYTTRKQSNDQQEHGKRAVKRINRKLNEGKTRDQALHEEDVRNAYQRLAVVGAGVLLHVVATSGATPLSDLSKYTAQRAHDNRTASLVTAIGSKAAKVPYSKVHKGVYSVTTMK
jgi:hypothetical protein